MMLLVLQVLSLATLQAQVISANHTSPYGHIVAVTVDLSNAQSEQEITYTIKFSLPTVATSAPNAFRITFFYPHNMVRTGGNYPTVYGAAPGLNGFNSSFTFTNAVFNTQTMGQVEMTFNANNNTPWPAVRTITADFQVKVKVPPATACLQDADMTAYATMLYTAPTDGFVSTIKDLVHTQLVIDNPWQMNKYSISSFFLGTTAIGNCQYGTNSRTIRYRLELHLLRPELRGSQDVSITQMQDIVNTAVAGFVYFRDINMPGVTIAGNSGNFTLPSGGFPLSASDHIGLSRSYWLEFDMTIPNNTPAPTCIQNTVNYWCNDPCGQPLVPSPSLSATAHVLFSNIPNPGIRTVSKSAIELNGNTTGCSGRYRIRVTGPRNGYNLTDNFPPCLTVNPLNNATIPAGGTFNLTGGNNYQIQSNTNLATANDVHEYFIPFTISNGPLCGGNTVDNVVLEANGTEASGHATFWLLPQGTLPCIRKQTCNNPGTIGSDITFRLQIQNRGTIPMTNWSFTDDLRSIGLEFVPGSERYYYTTSRSNVGNNCSPVINNTTILPWNTNTTTNASSSWDNGSGILSFHFNTLNLLCDDHTLYENMPFNCNGGGALPAYYIEFKAKITSNVGIGASKNIAKLYNDQNVYVDECFDVFTINQSVNVTLKKEVSTDNGSAYTSNAAVTYPGHDVYYKISAYNTGLTLFNPRLIDFLPQNYDLSAGVNDRYLLQSGDRGSTIHMFYDGFVPVGSSAGATNDFENINELDATMDLGSTAITGPNQPLWTISSYSSLTKNFRVRYPLNPFSSGPLTYIFKAKPENKLGNACNTAGILGFKKSMHDYVAVLEAHLPAESNKVCVEVKDKPDGCCIPDSFAVPREVCYNYETQFCVIDNCACLPVEQQNVYTWSFGDNTPTVTGKCVSHVYMTGTGSAFDIKVSWTDCNGEHEQIFKVKATDCQSCVIRPDFYWTVTPPRTVNFNAAATYTNLPGALYVWDFGDGTFGTGISPAHTYVTNTGTQFAVTLTVMLLNPSGEGCCSEKITKEEVRVEDEFPNKTLAKSSNGRVTTREITVETSSISLIAKPNPFKQELLVSIVAAKTNMSDKNSFSLSLLNENGVLLATKSHISNNLSIHFDTKTYPAGVYVLLLKGSDGSIRNTKAIKLNY